MKSKKILSGLLAAGLLLGAGLTSAAADETDGSEEGVFEAVDDDSSAENADESGEGEEGEESEESEDEGEEEEGEDEEGEEEEEDEEDDGAALSKPNSFAASKQTNVSLTLSWSKVKSAEGYEVQQNVNNKWVKLKTITSGSTVSLKVTKLKAGTNYKFRVRAYATDEDDEKIYSDFDSLSAATNPSKVAGLKASKKTKNAITLKWKKNASATGYEIQQKVGANWVSVKTVAKNKTVSAKLTKLKKNTSYKFRIRAYKKIGNATYYGAFSNVSGKTKA